MTKCVNCQHHFTTPAVRRRQFPSDGTAIFGSSYHWQISPVPASDKPPALKDKKKKKSVKGNHYGMSVAR